MDIIIFLIGISLAIDCFAVSICIGTSNKEYRLSKYEIPLFFGFFQFFMTLMGYYGGNTFKSYIESFDHWIAFFLLLIIGMKMIIESRKNSCEKIGKLSFKKLITLSIATSIDALVVGIALSMIDGNIIYKSIIIGICAFTLSLIGLLIGKKIKSYEIGFIEILGGIVLIAIGIKNLF